MSREPQLSRSLPGQTPLQESATRDALAAALAAEHAAVWSYGLASAFLPPTAAGTVVEGAAAHRARRDALEALSEAAGIAPVAAAAAYRVPAPVTDAVSAAGLLAVAEDDTTAAWRAVLERTDDPGLRRTGVEAMVAGAIAGVRWRRVAGTTPLVAVFPGSPTA